MKHAYLIIAHNNSFLLRFLLSLIDDFRNDIYLHIDKKSEDMYREFLSYNLMYSNLFVLRDRIDVRWGHISQIEAEYLLLKRCLKSGCNYMYIHLLSGVDLPLKSQNYIHDFFCINEGLEFVGFSKGQFNERDLKRKTEYIWILTKYLKTENRGLYIVSKIVRKLFLLVQSLFSYRKRYDIEIKKGSSWFSITCNFAKYIVEKEQYVMRLFKNVPCCDEMFVQTLLWNSPFKEKIYNLEDEFKGCMRLIDWRRGCPYVWRKEDEMELRNSEMLFARKFDSCRIDKLMNIVSSLCE